MLRNVNFPRASQGPRVNVISQVSANETSSGFIFMTGSRGLYLPTIGRPNIRILRGSSIKGVFASTKQVRVPRRVQGFTCLFCHAYLICFYSVFRTFFSLTSAKKTRALFNIFSTIGQISCPRPISERMSIKPRVFMTRRNILRVTRFCRGQIPRDLHNRILRRFTRCPFLINFHYRVFTHTVSFTTFSRDKEGRTSTFTSNDGRSHGEFSIFQDRGRGQNMTQDFFMSLG